MHVLKLAGGEEIEVHRLLVGAGVNLAAIDYIRVRSSKTVSVLSSSMSQVRMPMPKSFTSALKIFHADAVLSPRSHTPFSAP